MSALVAGREYGLSSNESTSANKTVLHIKLTDSALKAIEEYQKFKGKSSSKANIQFLGSHGTIQIPSSSSDVQTRHFKFNLTTPQVDSQNKGSFDCIRQDSSTSSLDYIGEMKHKLTVCATDEVFQTTRQKVAEAESQSKKYCAKEIKMSGMRGSLKKVTSRSTIIGHVRNSISNMGAGPTSGHQHPLQHSHQHPVVSPNARLPTSASMPMLQPHHQVAKPRSVLNTIQSEIDPTSRSKSRSPIAGSSNSKTSNKGIHRNISYRDRIIHYLALRPHKQFELSMRLQKDGVREKDKLMVTLKQVATHNVRLNQFTLHKHLYAEVRPTFPIYTDQDRVVLKQRIQELTGPSPNHTNSPIVSPVHSNCSQASSPDSSGGVVGGVASAGVAKRQSPCDEGYQSNTNKRQRLAHVRKPIPTTTTLLGPPSGGAAGPNTTATMARPLPPMNSTRPVAVKVSHETVSEHAAVAEEPDYQSKYVKITSKKQRTMYKDDFNKEYDSYLALRLTIEHISTMFSGLRDELRRHEEGTKEYEDVRDRIFKEYARVKSEPTYSERRVKCDRLHRRLAFVKARIHDYDQSH